MKNKPEDNERKFFQDRFDDFASEPDEAVWKKIAGELPPPAARPFFTRKRLLLAVGVIVVSVSGLVWWLGASHPADPQRNGSVPVVLTPATHSQASAPDGTTETRKTAAPQPQAPPTHPTAKPTGQHSIRTHADTTTQHSLTMEKDGFSGNTIRETLSKPKRHSLDKLTETQPSRTRLITQNKVNSLQNRNALPASSNLGTRHPSGNNPSDKAVLAENSPADVRLTQPEPLNRQTLSTSLARQAGKNSILENLKSRSVLVHETNVPVKSLVFHPLVWKPNIEPQKQRAPKLWRAYAGFTHWMNYYAVTPVTTDSVLVNQVELGKTLASQRSGWQGQAGVIYPLTERLHLRAGVFYYQQKQQVIYQTQELYPAASTVTPVGTDEVRVKHTYHKESQYIESQQQNAGLRMDLRYQLGKLGTFRQYVSGGGQVALMWFNENSSQLRTDVQIGYGLARPLSRRLECWLEPTFRYSLNNRLDPARYTRIRPYYFGISAGVNVSLR
jgi:hypothetical protein